MCVGNRAESSVHYINSQLHCLWENAKRCAQKPRDKLKPSSSEVEYGICLREFYGPGKENRHNPSLMDFSFYASFNAPRIEFVCNHEVILFIEIESGHFSLDMPKYGSKSGHHGKIENVTCAFRLDFHTFNISNIRCQQIGNSDSYTTTLLILNFASASFCEELSSLPGVTCELDGSIHKDKQRRLDALIYHIKQYFSSFKRAGLHVLHSLPDFDNLKSTSSYIDYSVVGQRTLSVNDVFGINVVEINKYLKSLWLQATVYIDGHDDFHHHTADVHQCYLAEHRSMWTDTVEDVNFHLYFGPPEVQAMCKREVVMYFNIQDVLFHLGGGFHDEPNHRFENWKVAILVDIKYEEVDQGCVRRISLDLSTARFCQHLSFMEGECEDSALFIRLQSTLVRYITRYYLKVVEAAGHHCVYHHDTRIRIRWETEITDIEEEISECDCDAQDSCGHAEHGGHIRWGCLESRRIEFCDSDEYDCITAITQGSINTHLRSIWEQAWRKVQSLGQRIHTWDFESETCLSEYSLIHEDYGEEVFFSATFGAPQIQFVCDEGSKSVVLYLHLQDGHLKTLGHNRCFVSGGEEHSFANWYIAFTVDLKLRDCSDEHKVLDAIMKQHGRYSHSDFKQLVLDFSTARFCSSQSHIPGLLDEHDIRLVRSKRGAIVHYLKHSYFPALVRGGHHVLYTIPVYNRQGCVSRYSMTSVDFQISPFTFGDNGSYVQDLFGSRRSICERNMIVFLGMTEHRPHPRKYIAHRGNWVVGIGKDVPHGTVCISRKMFLEGTILEILAAVNRDTTIVPQFSGIDSGEWILELTTWQNHQLKTKHSCGWKEITSSSDRLDFVWKNRDDWRYEHEGDSGHNGTYRVDCTTRNTLSIPSTHKRDTCTFQIKGEVRVSLSYEGGCNNWSAELTSIWSAAISLAPDSRHGLKVKINPTHIIPEISRPQFNGAFGSKTVESVYLQLKQHLPGTITLNGIVDELSKSLEGTWSHLCMSSNNFVVTRPSFNRKGDLLLELRPAFVERPKLIQDHSKESFVKHAWHTLFGSKEESNGKNSKPKSATNPPSPPPHYSPPKLGPRAMSGSSKIGIFGKSNVSQASLTHADDVEDLPAIEDQSI